MPHPSAFVPGTLLEGRYRIVAQLGRGGMGEVYRADDLRLGQSVALKFLPAELEQDYESRERLLAEVRLARTIAHPNVCKVYDIGDLATEDGLPARSFISMEYIDGEDLASLLRRIGRLPAAKALDIARQLCAGLAAAHDKGVLHRDLKPANVMLDGRGQVKIADFGIAVDVTLGDAFADNAGTVAYMAPERFYGEPASVRSDLYALGLILYETVTGSAALKVSSPLEWAAAHAASMPTDPSSLASDVDPALSRVILRCLEKDPTKRPASAAQVAAALPGGDPLAAALAAGETPSPELVAASGEEGTLSRGKAIGWFVAAVASFGFSVWVTAPALLINQLPMRLSTEALEQRAREVLVSFGHTTPPVDWASEWERGEGADSMSLRLRYRQDPEGLVPLIGASPLKLAARFSESALLLLDSDGRLLDLDVGGAQSYSDTTPQREPDWAPLFAAIGVEGTPVPTSARRWPPAHFADTRAAWTGTIKGVRNEIEAAGLRGPITSVRIRPVGAPDEPAVPPATRLPIAMAIVVGVILVVMTLLGVLANRNARLGRGDRRGALRLATFVLVALFVDTLLNRHWFFSPDSVLFGSFYSVYFPLFLAAATWVCYLGLEPFVRRRWPSLLVGWTRLVDGRFRDGLVGQAILAGIIGGSLGLNLATGSTLSRALGVPTAFYFPLWADSMWFRYAALNVATGALYVGVLVASRMLLRRDWAAWCAMSLFFFAGFAGGRWSLPLPVFVVVAILPTIVSIGLLYRFGFLAFVVASFVGRVIAASSISHDPSRWYFWHATPGILLVLALATWGFRNVLGRQSLMPEGALD